LWIASINDNNGNQVRKNFAKTQDKNPKKAAIAWRKQREEEIGYLNTN
jgi:hypothetical protein